MRRTLGGLIGVGLLLVFGAGCDQQGPDGSAKAMCAKVVACAEMTREECTEMYEPLVLPAGCVEGILEGGEEDCSTLEDAALYALCFPTCSTESYICLGNETIQYCYEGSLYQARCEEVCYYSDSGPYSGECGQTAPNGQTSDHDVCWCLEN